MTQLTATEKSDLRLLLADFYSNGCTEVTLRPIFELFDRNHDGKISRSELALTLRGLQSGVTDNRVDAMMDQADVNGDGQLDMREFVRAMQRARH